MSVEVLEFRSAVLRNNPLGDPELRRIPVYLPPRYPRGRYPVFYVLSGFMGSGEMLLGRTAWTESLPERLDRLIKTRAMSEAIVVMPDCFTRYGGSQYLNSSATGRYEDHLVRELVPYVDRCFRGSGRRAVLGKSSGGYGALVLGMRHPETFAALACHSGDMYFEYCYLPDFPKALDTLRSFGGCARFLREWQKMPKRNRSDLFPALNTIAMAACYSPRGRSFDLPFDEKTGEIRGKVWKRWKAWDPVEMIRHRAGSLRRLRLVFLDCGTRDPFALHHGARIFAQEARRRGVSILHEEFDDDHSNLAYRYDRSFRVLSRALSKGPA